MPPKGRARSSPWPTGRRRRRRKPLFTMSRRGRGVLAVVFAVVAIAALTIGLLTETVLWYLLMVVSGLASVAQRRAMQFEAEREQQRRANRPPQPPHSPRPNSSRAAPPPGNREPGGEPKPGSLRCTETGKPLDGDQACNCHSKHVRTQKGVKQFGRPLGTPYGARNRTATA